MKRLAMADAAVALGAAPARATVMATDFFDAPATAWATPFIPHRFPSESSA